MNIKIGTQIGNWRIISDRFKENGVYKNTCECICGTVRNVLTWQLNNNKSKSCGCTNTVGRFKAECVGELSKSYYTSFKYSRKSKGKLFSDDVTMTFLWSLFLKQNKKCALSGLDIILNPQWSNQNNGRKTKVVQTASIDRKDSKKNYTTDNIQWVHKDINKMKGMLSDKEFINFCKTVSNFSSTGK